MTNFDILASEAEAIGFDYDGDNLHTFQSWKAKGFQVKKGQKALIKCEIWKKSTKKEKNEETGELEENGRFFLKSSCFFSNEQVEKVGK